MDKMTDIYVKPPFIKLEQFLKFSGVCETGGEAKLVIAEQNVQVNGEICTMRGKKLVHGDVVEYNGQILRCCFE